MNPVRATLEKQLIAAFPDGSMLIGMMFAVMKRHAAPDQIYGPMHSERRSRVSNGHYDRNGADGDR